MKMTDSTTDSTIDSANAFAAASFLGAVRSAPVRRMRHLDAPIKAEQGTAVPFAGFTAASAALVATHVGARSTDLPGSPSRGAPV